MGIVTAKQTTDVRRIRGPYLAAPISKYCGVPFEEGLLWADAANHVIASNKRLNQTLAHVGSEEWETICAAFACWTGTMTAYAKPGEKLGKAVEYMDSKTGYRWIFPVPEEHQGKANAILVAEHPDYSLEIDGKTRIVRAAQVDLIERFPAKDGWYMADAQHNIPVGELLEVLNADARYLRRIGLRVGPVVRGPFSDCYIEYINPHVVLLDVRPSYGFGMAVEAPERPQPSEPWELHPSCPPFD